MNPSTVFWIAAMVFFGIVEAATVSLVSIWFAFGSLIAMVTSLFTSSFPVSLVVMIFSTGISLFALRPLAKKYFTPGLTKTNVESVPGQEGYVLKTVDNLAATGTVKLGAMEWTARSTGGAIIPEGSLVRVDRIEGVKVFVTPVKSPEYAERS